MYHPTSITGNDFDQCYDRVGHTGQSVTRCVNSVLKEAVQMKLLAFETMAFCLQTGFGEYKQSFGGTIIN